MPDTLLNIMLVLAITHISEELCTIIDDRCVRYEQNAWRNRRYEQHCVERIKNVICTEEITLQTIGSAHYGDATQVEIRSSNVSLISINSFHVLSSVLSLIITSSNVQSIEIGAFNGLQTLKSLSLSNNSISTISTGIFNHLLNLNSLDLSGNNIKTIDIDSLVGMKSLTSINFAKNNLESISPLINNCDNLVLLDVSYNKLKHIDSLKNCTSLTKLYLDHNEINNISETSFQFGQLPLVHLDISFNKLNYLAVDTFEGLKDVTHLDLSNNLLNETYNGQLKIGTFQHMVSLITLRLSSNGFTSFPLGSFSKLSVLRILDISNNTLKNLPKNLFHDLTNLAFLNISNNRLSKFEAPKREWVEIRLDNNLWTCDGLEKIAELYGGVIAKGSNYNVSNIFGIPCIPDDITEINNKFLNDTSKENDGKYYEYLLNNITKQYQDFMEKMQDGYVQQNQNFLNILETQVGSKNVSTYIQQLFQQNQKFLTDLKSEFESFNTKDIADLFQQVLGQNKQLIEGIQSERSRLKEPNFEGDANETISAVATNQHSSLELNSTSSHNLENILIWVLIVLILFLIVFLLSFIYVIRSLKLMRRINQIDDMHL